jgi:hypothetical protein
MEGIKVHVIVDEVSSIMERTCRAAGSGLLRLDTTDPYRLDQIVSPDEYSAIAQAHAYRDKVKELRRRLERKLDMNLGTVNENYANVQTLTQGWSPQRRDHYISSVEEADTRWREWGDRMSTKLDELGSGGSEEALRLIEVEIERGAIDVDIDSGNGDVEEA